MNRTANSSDHLSPHTNRGNIQQTMRIRPGRALYNMVSAGNAASTCVARELSRRLWPSTNNIHLARIELATFSV